MNNYIFPFLWMRGESEDILRTEIEKIYECGIRAVCLEARPHDDFCGPGWWHDFDIVLEEAKKRGMKIWILDDKHFPTGYANGLIGNKYPERKKLYINTTTADIFGSAHPKTLNIKRMLRPAIGFWEIGQPANLEEREKNQLYSIVAVRLGEGTKCKEETIDLTDTFDGTFANFTLPQGQWRIFVTYKTRTDGGDENYINMIDSVSAHTQIEGVYEAHYEHYAEEFGKTIAGFFSDEPQFGNLKEHLFDSFDTRLCKKKMPLPWSEELQEMLQEKYGEKLQQILPYLFMESEEQELASELKYDYMDCVSRLYEKCFSRAIGDWCAEHGVEYIGHVVEDNHIHSRLGMGAAHFFRALSGQHMAGIDSIGSQIVFGAPVQRRKAMIDGDGEFYHYILGKLGASAGHLDPRKKGRTLCELFGAYGWNFGVRDMKYLLDHLLVKGINQLVPHAFSMAEYPDPDCPPHFYARGNNPQFAWFAELMKYANRMCDLLNGGQHVASVALLYDGEFDWVGEHISMQKTARQLIENQIEFDVVSLDMLKNPEMYNGRFTENALELNGVHFDALVIGGAKQIPEELAEIIRKNQMPVYFTEYLPERLVHGTETLYQQFIDSTQIKLVKEKDLAEKLREEGYAKVSLSEKFMHLSFYHYKKEKQIFLFMNEDPDQIYSGKITLPTERAVCFYDAMKAENQAANYEVIDGKAVVSITLEPGHSCVLMEDAEEKEWKTHDTFEEIKGSCEKMDLSSDWKVNWVKAIDYPKFTEEQEKQMETLYPISEKHAIFSGIIRYEKKVQLEQIPSEAYLSAEEVFDVCRVTVNGQNAGVSLIPPYYVSCSDLLKRGENTIVVEVATTAARDQMNYPMPPFDFTHEAMEPTGMYGEIALYTK